MINLPSGPFGIFLLADGAAADQGVSPLGLIGTLIMPLALLGVLWFIMIRPQRKREKELKKQRESMTVGDKIITIGGIVGKVVNIRDDEVTISTSVANNLVTFRKEAINQVIKPISDDD